MSSKLAGASKNTTRVAKSAQPTGLRLMPFTFLVIVKTSQPKLAIPASPVIVQTCRYQLLEEVKRNAQADDELNSTGLKRLKASIKLPGPTPKRILPLRVSRAIAHPEVIGSKATDVALPGSPWYTLATSPAITITNKITLKGE